MPNVSQSNADDSPLVASLAQFKRTDVELAGGKGANLGELTRMGLEIPPGFVITTTAYDLLLQYNHFHFRMGELLSSLDPADSAAVTQIGKRIQKMLMRAHIPAELAAEVLSAYRQLGTGAVAVRSSATAEDLPQAAFAGQQETYLNVIGEQALLEAVAACWASLWSERAVLYRARQNIDQSSVKLAVVVQAMVPADYAGVLFTANPVTGGRGELMIDANPGLGEAVVGGMVTPDHIVVDKRSMRIKSQNPGRREVVIRSRPGGGTEKTEPAQDSVDIPTLPDSVVRKLAQLGIQIERHFGAPQDIEWAWVSVPKGSGQVYILQARPMTALPPPLKSGGLMRRIVPMLAEMWHTRPYPLDMTTFTEAIEHTVGNFLAKMVGRGAPSLDKSFVEEDGVVVRFEPPEFHPTPGLLFAPWIAFWRARQYDPQEWERDPLLTEVIEKAGELEKRDLRELTWGENIATLREALALIPRAMVLRDRYFPQALLGIGGLWLLLALARRLDHFGDLVSGVETKTTETNRALETLAARIRSEPVLRDLFEHANTSELYLAIEQSQTGQVFLKSFNAFLDRYGHRETALTISQPAWKDRPEIVLEILKVLVRTEPQEGESYRKWIHQRDELLAHYILGVWPLRGLFLKALARARCLFKIREDTHFYATLMQPPLRRVALELGRRLEQVGVLATPEEVFHLRLEELEPVGEPWPPAEATLNQLRALVVRRKNKRAVLAARPFIDPRLLSVDSAKPVGEDVLLIGTAGSPGRASGPARIIRDSSEFSQLQRGDVLVAPVTNPGWTPLFQRATAVVVDTGGPASHAAIVAREYGIPAVMGTVNGTQKLSDGQWIQVDGSRGLVLKAVQETRGTMKD